MGAPGTWDHVSNYRVADQIKLHRFRSGVVCCLGAARRPPSASAVGGVSPVRSPLFEAEHQICAMQVAEDVELVCNYDINLFVMGYVSIVYAKSLVRVVDRARADGVVLRDDAIDFIPPVGICS